jgi:hypothetical protein
MESSLSLQANFVTNPFPPVKGSYNGLFFISNSGVTEETAGMLKNLTINQKGIYSGALLIGGARHAISGTFNLALQASKVINRPLGQGGPVTLEMTLVGSSNAAPQLTGYVFGTNNNVPWTASLLADFATNTQPAAEYTMLIPPDTNNAPPISSPGGDGYMLTTNYQGTARNPASATARISGALADGTTFNQAVPVSQAGLVPIYASLYGNKGLLLGWISLDITNTNTLDFTGLTWIHPARGSGLYPNGFTNVVLTNQIQLSPWSNAALANLRSLTNFVTLDTINDTDDPSAGTNSVTIAASGKVTGTSVSGSINPRTGLLKATVATGSSWIVGYGAILLNKTNGAGYYLTKTNTAEAIELRP